ncbi:hypothetical protein B0A52_05309 [Exophiala mesophila]|uniref:Uncharacterized protein n=1 Tax=Exophiala mesophila TaxID=212818 RepID=A0A438N4L2_EXOME|nr:hypothetical protein B0A52_05309 [Exophiala mesophila]
MAVSTSNQPNGGSTQPSSSKQPEPPSADSKPLAAQIPLQDFHLPTFPPEASSLRELTLTADIKLDDYQTLLQTTDQTSSQHKHPSTLPTSITHLALELFNLGFPGKLGFLTGLARSLPNLTSVTFFSCLLDGLDDNSREDAVGFFATAAPKLVEVHFIDSFARPGFFTQVAAAAQGFQLVDVSYTFRGHEDSDFLARIQGDELTGLLLKGLVGASFTFVPAVKDDLSSDDPTNTVTAPALGILPFATDGRAPAALRKRFESAGAAGHLTGLRVLDLSMWTLRASEVGQILIACAGGRPDPTLAHLTVSLLLEDGWLDSLVRALEHGRVAAALESLEIVGVPVEAKDADNDWQQSIKLLQLEDLDRLTNTSPKLCHLEQNILKVKNAQSAVYVRENGQWESR